MNLSLLLFIIGLVFMIIGYAHQVSPIREQGREIEYVPRDVYDNLVKSNLIT